METQPIRIDAPSALLGFFLALRLQGHDARVHEAGDGAWIVELSSDAPREWVLSSVQRWLDDEALEQVAVYMDGRTYTMTHS